MQSYQRILSQNKDWATEKSSLNPDFFEKLVDDQHPNFLWIGCSDSRVPADQVTGTQPGEIFVHRNVANLVHHTDMNLLSVLQYAVEVLKVKHILVVGHYNCGGIKAAMGNHDYGLISNWLHNVKNVYEKHAAELNKIEDEHQRLDRLTELNVIEQVNNLTETTIIQGAWHRNKDKNQFPQLHGWVFDMKTGFIKPIIEVNPSIKMKDIYKFDF